MSSLVNGGVMAKITSTLLLIRLIIVAMVRIKVWIWFWVVHCTDLIDLFLSYHACMHHIVVDHALIVTGLVWSENDVDSILIPFEYCT